MVAVEQGHLNTISFLINNMDANVLAVDDRKRSALHRAAAHGYEECCVAILKANATAAWQRDVKGLLPIHYAVLAGHANLISMFLEYLSASAAACGASLDDRLLDSSGFSLLHFACFHGRKYFVKFFF